MQFNINELFGKMGDLQNQMQQVRQKLDSITVQGESGGGMVKATVTASRTLKKVAIEPTAMDDREMLEDLIVAAVNQAMERAADTAQEEMAKMTQGLIPGMPGIPGMDITKFGL